MPIHDTASYIQSIKQKYATGITSEHSFRSDLEQLINVLVPDVQVTNEPSQVTDCGNPDYVITKGKIPIGYIEAKDIGKDLNSKTYKEQFTRYKDALDNLIVTDYCWFQFWDHGTLTHEIRIAEVHDGKLVPFIDNFKPFDNLIRDFCAFIGQTIKSPKKLAIMMAAKARLLQDTLENALKSDEDIKANSELRGQMKSFKELLIHDITPKRFADLYAQTLAYGMFAARYHDPTIEDFTRQEAAELLPKSNPFLRKLFNYIAGPDIDPRIKGTVDNLADLFRATDVHAIMHNFGKATAQEDPIIHFYETFLAEYDPRLRKSRGVYYTPEPVVDFIVRAVDDILKTEFGLAQGLADNSKVEIEVNSQTPDARSKTGYKRMKKQVHRVQILDPATGTGTFLARVIRHIYETQFQKMQGAWSGYVENDLIPRLNGFEILMASYAMAHLKLDMILSETGYSPTRDQRLNVFLTNSLEPGTEEVPNLFMAQWLTEEAAQANEVKQNKPVMIVLGNPPYSVSSSNKGEWIDRLIADYKRDLNEKSYNSLSDDYVKFIRYGQHFIEKNGSGVVAYISNNSFIDGIVFRQMRKHLLECFDKLYILDLHGNSKKKEVSPDGSQDQNVFDIMQGVSINIFVKTGKKKKNELGKVFNSDLFGNRKFKYDNLNNNDLRKMNWKKLNNLKPNYFFVEKDFEGQTEYERGFYLPEFMRINSNGFTSEFDQMAIHFNKKSAAEVLNDILTLENVDILKKYDLRANQINKIERAKNDLSTSNIDIISCLYRPFDFRYTSFSGKTNGLFGRPRYETLQHLKSPNLAFIIPKQNDVSSSGFVTNLIAGHKTFSAYNKNTIFPLYLKNVSDSEELINSNTLINFNIETVQKLETTLSLKLNLSKTNKGGFSPEDIFDYIYAILNSKNYIRKYKEFLKIDFPRIPYPEDAHTFRTLVGLGAQIRELHLLEAAHIDDYITTYPMDGSNEVTRKMTKASIGYEPVSHTHGRVWINDDQYFDEVPLIAWEFYIGGYQPAQKWLKDRRGRTLSINDIRHYQRIIVALTETDRLMKEIDEVWEV